MPPGQRPQQARSGTYGWDFIQPATLHGKSACKRMHPDLQGHTTHIGRMLRGRESPVRWRSGLRNWHHRFHGSVPGCAAAGLLGRPPRGFSPAARSVRAKAREATSAATTSDGGWGGSAPVCQAMAQRRDPLSMWAITLCRVRKSRLLTGPMVSKTNWPTWEMAPWARKSTWQGQRQQHKTCHSPGMRGAALQGPYPVQNGRDKRPCR